MVFLRSGSREIIRIRIQIRNTAKNLHQDLYLFKIFHFSELIVAILGGKFESCLLRYRI